MDCTLLGTQKPSLVVPCELREAGVLMPRLAVFVCPLHARCTPTWRPNPRQLEAWRDSPEGKMLAICQLCPDKVTADS